MLSTIQSSLALYLAVEIFLMTMYKGKEKNININDVLTLALMVTGIILSPHVQLWGIALNLPFEGKLHSLVRQFERFVANNRVDVRKYFEPFVQAMILSLGNETAYLIMDCTKSGRKCRTLFIGLAYHNTVIPVAWKTIKGKKGHVKGEFQEALLSETHHLFSHCRRVIVLGDAEFSNETVINSPSLKNWGFVFRFQSNYQVKLDDDGPWQSAQEVFKQSGLKPGQVRHWELSSYTQEHQIPGLTMTIHWGEGQEEPLFLISLLKPDELAHLIYNIRFWIETLFGNCKSRGFQLDRTEMTHPDQIDRLILGIAISTCFMLGLGTEIIVTEQTDQVDRPDRRDLSIFQLGWRWLHRLIARNRLKELHLTFRWDINLPPAGFRPAT